MLGVMLRYGLPVPHKAAMRAFAFQMLLWVSCIAMWNYDGGGRFEFGPVYMARWGSYQLKPAVINRQLTEELVAQFEAGAGDLGSVAVEEGFNSLIWGKYKGQVVLRPKFRTAKIDTIFYFANPPGEANEIIMRSGWRHDLHNNYCMLTTPVCVLTNRSLDKFGNMAYLLSPLDFKTQYKPTEKDLKNTGDDD